MDEFWAGFRASDEWIIRLIQGTYLWLLDRTGVYVATLAFGVYAIAVGIEITVVGGEPWLWCAFLALIGAGNIPKYLMQERGETTLHNSIALLMQQSTWRLAGNSFLIGMGLGELIFGYFFWQAVIDLLFCLYMYLLVIMIRDRDKKPFFEKKEQLALGGST